MPRNSISNLSKGKLVRIADTQNHPQRHAAMTRLAGLKAKQAKVLK